MAPPAREAEDERPPDPAEVVAAAQAAGAKVEAIPVSEDLSMTPSLCIANPANGCLGSSDWAQHVVDRPGIERWAVDLAVTWTATTDLTRSLEGSAQMYWECAVGCRAGSNETLASASVSPMEFHGVLDEPPEGEPKGFWLIVRARGNLPGGSTGNTGQAVHIEGTLFAIDDR